MVGEGRLTPESLQVASDTAPVGGCPGVLFPVTLPSRVGDLKEPKVNQLDYTGGPMSFENLSPTIQPWDYRHMPLYCIWVHEIFCLFVFLSFFLKTDSLCSPG